MQGQAIVAGAADAGWQEAGLTTIIDWEVDIRCVEHRNILHPQGHVGRGAETGGRVQGDVVALQVPGVAARFAAGVSAVFQADNRAFFAFGVERAAANVALVHNVFGVIDLGFAVVQLQLGAVTHHQHALVAQAYIADQLTTVFCLMQVGFVCLDLHACLTQDHITGEGGNLFFLLIARSLGRDEHRRFVHRRLVVHARTSRLYIRTGAVRAGFCQLSGSEVLTRDPIKVAVISAA